mmetsp:Transcript_5456/g.14021  ORF Transcript_5456/g.14021 Transcript_5456/m.14021 type:complete len:118 (-) Transcript_5456:708-1061(-)
MGVLEGWHCELKGVRGLFESSSTLPQLCNASLAEACIHALFWQVAVTWTRQFSPLGRTVVPKVSQCNAVNIFEPHGVCVALKMSKPTVAITKESDKRAFFGWQRLSFVTTIRFLPPL